MELSELQDCLEYVKDITPWGRQEQYNRHQPGTNETAQGSDAGCAVDDVIRRAYNVRI